MKTATQINTEFQQQINFWKSELNNYNDEQFSKKPADDKWSIGQLYYHLAFGTQNFHLKMIELCLEQKNVVLDRPKNIKGKISFLIGGFPPVKIKVPPTEQYTPKQSSVEEIKSALDQLSVKMSTVSALVDNSNSKVKVAHPGFSYLNAKEWYQLIEMHFRHHRRQKAELDLFLKSGVN